MIYKEGNMVKHHSKLTCCMVQLTAMFTLMCPIHACVVQFYSSDLLELACHTQVRLPMLDLSQSRVLHASLTLCVLHAS